MLSSLAAYGDDNVRMEEKTVTVNDKALTVEVARTIEEQRKGLMFRTELAAWSLCLRPCGPWRCG